MQTLQDDGRGRETETDDQNRYCGGGHATETAETADQAERQAAVNELVAVIRQASRELALLMAEIEAERTNR